MIKYFLAFSLILLFSGCFMSDFSTITKDANSTASIEKIDKLINMGRINDVDKQGMSLLAWAVFWNNEELVKKLLESKARVDIPIKNNHIWNIALNARIIKQRESQDDKNSKVLKEEARYPKVGVIELLVKNGLNVNEKLKDSNTPLHLAGGIFVLGADEKILDTLLKNRADASAKNDKNQTVFEYSKTVVESVKANPNEFGFFAKMNMDEKLIKLEAMLKGF